MKVYNPLCCGGGEDFPSVESDLILTGSVSYSGDSEYSVLIDDDGNVLSKDNNL